MDNQLLAICEMEIRNMSEMEHVYSIEEDDIVLDREVPEKDIFESKREELDAKLAEVSPQMANALIAVMNDDSDVYALYEMSAAPEELQEYFTLKHLALQVRFLEDAYIMAQELDYLPLDQAEDTNEFNYLYFNCVDCYCDYVLDVFREQHAKCRERHLQYMEMYLKVLSRTA